MHKMLMKARAVLLRIRRVHAFVKRKIFDVIERIYIAKHKLGHCNNIFTHMTAQEKIALHRVLMRYFRGDEVRCLEIGSYLGGSSCFIAYAISAGSTLYCIDTWCNDAMKYCDNDMDAEPRDTFQEFRENTAPVGEKIRVVRKRSEDAICDIKFLTKNIDFLFIDGDHTYEGVRADWNNYSPLLRSGAVVFFHDTGWADGVNKVIEEFVIDNSVKIVELPNMQGFRML